MFTHLLISSPLAYAVPLVLVVAVMLLIPNALVAPSRLAASITVFGALLLCAAFVLLAERDGSAALFSHVGSSVFTLMLLATALSIAPLADRARPASLMIAAPVVAYAILSVVFWYLQASSLMILPAIIIAACVTALAGSALLPLHPARHTDSGQLRTLATPQAALLSGWALLGGSFIALLSMLGSAPDARLLAVCAITAALATLLTSRAQDGLSKAGESFAAAVLVASFTPLTLPIALGFGLLAAFFVNRSESISASLRLDDPTHLIGALLLPAMAGLLMPGVTDLAQLAPQLVWLGIALTTGLVLAALLWPVVMLLTGLRLPAKLVRAGVRAGG